MGEDFEDLDTSALALNGAGAVRAYGTTIHAWIARMPYVNEGGIVFDQGVSSKIRVAPGAPLYIEDDIKGRLVNGSRSSDGHYVVRGEVEQIPKWMRSDCGYALPEYEPKTIECSRCGVVHRKHSRPCECIFRMPALILSDVCVVGLRIYKRRCDDYINAERKRLLDWMFAPVMPTIPLFLPGLKNARATEISEEGTNTELSEPS